MKVLGIVVLVGAATCFYLHLPVIGVIGLVAGFGCLTLTRR